MNSIVSESAKSKNLPLVTVAMPIYNAGEYLRLSVNSIISQNMTNWELLIIDDGSTDNALRSIEDIVDSRIKIYSDGANLGLAVRLNQAIDLANGIYFARMDHDDVSYPSRFSRQISVLEDNIELDLVATRSITIDESNRITGFFPSEISHESICSRPWRGFFLPHPTWMGRIEWFRKNRYSEPSSYLCEDQELLLRTYLHSRFCTLDEILFAYRLKSKFNSKKIFKTRRTFYLLQFSFFLRRKMFYFLLLATIGFIIKSLHDHWSNVISNKRYFKNCLSLNFDNGIWQQVLKNLI